MNRTFAIHVHAKGRGRADFCPFIPRRVSILIRLVLKRLHCLLASIPPRPGSPPSGIFHPSRPTRTDFKSGGENDTPPPVRKVDGVALGMIMFRLHHRTPACAAPLGSFRGIKLRSDSAKSSFPTSSTGPIPLTIISLSDERKR